MVKFQTYRAETISSRGSFFTMEDGAKVSQYDFFKKYELTRDDHEELIEYCRKQNVAWFSTPSHPEDVELLESFNPLCYKTGSDDLTNVPFLKYIARKMRPMIVSTGMSTLSEVEKAVEAVLGEGNNELILLHCVVGYPSKPEDANLRVIETLHRTFSLPVGLSDHTCDEFTSILATQLGAVIIEKHFTLDHALGLPDDQAALDPQEFRKLVERVHLVPKALGTGIKEILEVEKKWREAARKSIYAARDIKQSEIIKLEDLVLRRPSEGIHPHHLEMIVGRKAVRDIPEGALLSWDMF